MSRAAVAGALLTFAAVSLLASQAAASSQPFDFDAYRHAIGIHESGGDYGTVNSIGYLGKYQMGAAAMVELGYLRRDVFDRYGDNRAFRDPSAWIAPWTRDRFLADGPEQERAMVRLTALNRASLERNGVLGPRSSAAKQAAWLAIAHGIGATGARRYYQTGAASPDAYGTTAAHLYRVGVFSQRHPFKLTAENKAAVRDGTLV